MSGRGESSRVFVTGVGVVSAAGSTVEALWDACREGRSVVAPIPPHWDTYYPAASRVWSPLPEIDFSAFGIGRTEQLTVGKPALLAIVAADQALHHAGLSGRTAASAPIANAEPGLRAGVFVGTGLGAAAAPFDNHYAHVMRGLRSALQQLHELAPDNELYAERLAALKATPRVNPLVICQTMPNATAAHLAIRYRFRGAADTSCAACASGTVAIGKAYKAVQRGEVDLALAGGVEHLYDRAGSVFMGFDRLQTLARPFRGLGTENRPFDRDRSGFLFSEGGAAFAVLESRNRIMMRGVRPLAEIIGYGETVDASSIAAIRADDNAIRLMISRALDDAAIGASEIDYVNAHGTSTRINDEIEAAILADLVGRHALVNSTKSILGHTLGAAGALEFVVTVLSLKQQCVHGSLNLEEPIADLNFCYETRRARLTHALTHNFGFGGHNAGLIVRCPPD